MLLVFIRLVNRISEHLQDVKENDTDVWSESRGGSGGLVEPLKLNVKTYRKRVVKIK